MSDVIYRFVLILLSMVVCKACQQEVFILLSYKNMFFGFAADLSNDFTSFSCFLHRILDESLEITRIKNVYSSSAVVEFFLKKIILKLYNTKEMKYVVNNTKS
ncbi:hypothetical protein ACKWTF_008478 [Chironomus riparius]